ncbi:MAG TPA: hypothetical protein EYP14_14600, partial [Planctomycetaceae bacterium]|nr:hypothetical protein [Planctomycetaceae bacterium]
MLDMTTAGFADGSDDTIDVRLNAAGDQLELRVNGTQIFAGDLADINTFRVVGSGDDETLVLTETAGGLPSFAGDSTVLTDGGHTNATFTERVVNAGIGPNNIGMHFEGNGGANALQVALTTARNTLYLPDTNEANSGVITIDDGAGSGVISFSFDELAPVTVTGGGGGDLLVDASSVPAVTALTIQDTGAANDGVNLVDGDAAAFEDVTFSGYGRLIVVGGPGAETIDLIDLDVGAGSPLTQVVLDGDDATDTDASADTLRVRSLPAAVNVTLLGGAGDDAFELDGNAGAAGGTVDNIAGQVFAAQNAAAGGAIPTGLTEEGTGNDTLTVEDTDDPAGDTVVVTATTIEGITGSAASPDITYGVDGQIETITINSSDAGGDAFNVRSTRSGSV